MNLFYIKRNAAVASLYIAVNFDYCTKSGFAFPISPKI